MTDAEQAIEKVLAGLREAEAPQGMEGRILRALDERTAARSSRKPWYVWMKTPGYARFVASAVVVVTGLTVLVIPTMHKPEHPTLDALGSGKTIAPDGFSSPKKGSVNATLNMPDRTKEGSIEWIASVLYNPDAVPQAKTLRGQSAPPIGNSGGAPSSREADRPEGIPDYDALAVSEMLAPSRPAPPLPLTHQERLLAQVVHKGEPGALATLRPDLRAKQMEISKAEFRDFFDPPPVKDNE